MNAQHSAVAETVLEAVAEVLEDVPIERLSLDLTLRGDLGFDSIMLMRLKFMLEQRVPEAGTLVLRDMVDNLVTPRAVADLLYSRLTRVPAVR